MWQSVQMPDADELVPVPDWPEVLPALPPLCDGVLFWAEEPEGLAELEELGLAEELLIPSLSLPPWCGPELLEELEELEALDELLELPAESFTEPNMLPSRAWVAVPLLELLVFSLLSGAILFTAMTPRANAPTAAAACTPVLMARRRDGSYGTRKADAKNAQCMPRWIATSAQSVYDEAACTAFQVA